VDSFFLFSKYWFRIDGYFPLINGIPERVLHGIVRKILASGFFPASNQGVSANNNEIDAMKPFRN
jgi:hypothetical protein